jgi:hypothetical protein
MLPWILSSAELSCVRLPTLSSMTFQCTQYLINTINAFQKNFVSSEIVLVGHELPVRNNAMERLWRNRVKPKNSRASGKAALL